jgi:hypothetical protein
MELVADIDTIQSQLAKSDPNRGIIKTAWEAVKVAATINGCEALVHSFVELKLINQAATQVFCNLES